MDSLARIREWVNAATPAPWMALDHGPMGVFLSAEPGRAPKGQRLALFDGLDNARFAAKAREVLPQVLNALDQQGLELVKIRGRNVELVGEHEAAAEEARTHEQAATLAQHRVDLLEAALREIRHWMRNKDGPEVEAIRATCQRLVPQFEPEHAVYPVKPEGDE
jgi:hypothetical protein